MAFAFEKRVVDQKSDDFADEICRQAEQFPRGYSFLVDQLNRAALLNAASIAEAIRGTLPQDSAGFSPYS